MVWGELDRLVDWLGSVEEFFSLLVFGNFVVN